MSPIELSWTAKNCATQLATKQNLNDASLFLVLCFQFTTMHKSILFSGGGRKRVERSCPGSLDLYSLTCKTWEKKCLTKSPQPGHVIISTLIAIIITILVFPVLLLFNVVLISKAQAGHVIITNLFFIIAILVILVNIIIVVLILTAQAGHYNGLCEQWVCEERPQHYRHPATVSS